MVERDRAAERLLPVACQAPLERRVEAAEVRPGESEQVALLPAAAEVRRAWAAAPAARAVVRRARVAAVETPLLRAPVAAKRRRS